MNLSRRQLLYLLPAASAAWEFVLAGTPEAAPTYNSAEHWWGMLLDVTKCIGCGSCVRACAVDAPSTVPQAAGLGSATGAPLASRTA